ncbi:hypothetical protein [Pragia fontium]|uniref:hypothetical protein n=1 Tax=Pragia fontium TaxID=82985 RepID=UPI00069BC98B|nr:hypothetical protein [Pragia fontium]
MGFDVSYHPISEQEINEWYFDQIEEIKQGQDCPSTAKTLAEAHNIEDFYINKYLDTLNVGAKTDPTDPFNRTHGLYVAVVQGFFRTYFYTRGSAFSFLIEDHPEFIKYTKPWQKVVPFEITNPLSNNITENYCSGVFIPYEQVIELLNDYNDPTNKQILDNFFSEQRIQVFLKALNYCQQHKLGLLEATEVITPNPTNLNESSCYSNLLNCDPDGLVLYAEAAMEQINQYISQFEAAEAAATEPKKKGFFSRFFGK